MLCTSETVCCALLVMGTHSIPRYSSIWHSNLSNSSISAGSIRIWVLSSTGSTLSPILLTKMAGLSWLMFRKNCLADSSVSSVTLNTNGALAISWSWFIVSVLSTSSLTMASMNPSSFPPNRSFLMITLFSAFSLRFLILSTLCGLSPTRASVHPIGTGCHSTGLPYILMPPTNA